MREKIIGLFLVFNCFWMIPASGQGKAVTIVVLGSSTAAGTGPSDLSNAWVNRYRRYVQSVNSQSEVINLAVGGYKTFHLMPSGYIPPSGTGYPAPDPSKNITKALSYSPDAIIINLPSNDASLGVAVDDQLKNYDAILALANEVTVPVWITTTQPRNWDQIRTKNLTDMKDSTYAHFGDKAIDFWTDIATSENTINPFYDSGDNIHLNDSAHGLLFKRVLDAGVLEFLSDSYLQAEDFWTSSNVEIAKDYSGNSGNGFIRFKAGTASSATYKIESDIKKTAELSFRYANKGVLSVAQFYVNGDLQIEELVFTNTGDETTWDRIYFNVELAEGENVIVLSCIDGDGGFSLDFISWDDDHVKYIKSPTATTSPIIINIDCGHNQSLTSGNWNNFTQVQNTPDSIVRLIDSDGKYSGICARIDVSFSGVNWGGGTSISDASLELPASATSDSYYGHTNTFLNRVVPTGSFIFTKLNSTIAYSFKIFGSRTATDNRETRYIVTGQNTGMSNLNASGNTSNIAIVENIYPDAGGMITLYAEPGINNNNDYGFFYLGAIRIIYTPSTITTDSYLPSDENRITIYPVPFKNSLSITNLPKQSTISVFSINGNKVLEVQNNERGVMTLNTSGFTVGIYILQISNTSLSTKTFKVIKG